MLEKRITAYPNTKNTFPNIRRILRIGYFGCINLSVVFTNIPNQVFAEAYEDNYPSPMS